jgi:hypothetical protein
MLSYSTIQINNDRDTSLTILQTNRVLQGLVLLYIATLDATESLKTYYGGTKMYIHISDMVITNTAEVDLQMLWQLAVWVNKKNLLQTIGKQKQ